VETYIQRLALLCGVGLFLCLSVPVLAVEYEPDDYTAENFDQTFLRYQLFTNGEPVRIRIVLDSIAVKRTGITEAHLRELMEAGLREARIPANFSPFTSVDRVVELKLVDHPIYNHGMVTVVSVDFWKTLSDPVSQRVGYSSTWGTTILVREGAPAKGFLFGVAGAMKRFSEAYHRANHADE